MNYIEVKATVKPIIPGNDIWISKLGEIGFESFVEDEEYVNAYVQEHLFDESALQSIVTEIHDAGFSIGYEISTIEDKNWNEEWEKNYEPVIVEDKCIIRAPFHQLDQTYTYDIVINPKMSFGTGHHETTYLCTSALADLELEGKDILDMGCGTGVLAILAAMRGAKRIVAIDNNEWAFKNTLENIQINNVPQIEVYEGDAHLLASMKGFDIIVANINRNILLADIPTYALALNTGGKLMMSGFFDMDVEAIKAKALEQGLNFDFYTTRNNWAFIVFNK